MGLRVLWPLLLILWSGVVVGEVAGEVANSTAESAAVPALVLQGQTLRRHNLLPYVEYWSDSKAAVAIADVPDEGFQASAEGPQVRRGFTQDAVWYRFTIRNETPRPLQLYITVARTLLDDIRFYHQRWQQPRQQLYQTGDQFPHSSRPIRSPKFVFPVVLEVAEETTYWLRIHSKSAHVFYLEIDSAWAYPERVLEDSLLDAVLYGLTLTLVIYHLILWATTREPTYGYYVLMVTFYFGCWMVIDGLAFMWLWPTATHWQQIAVFVTLNMACAGSIQFSRVYINIAEQSLLIDRVLIAIVYGCLAAVAFSFVNSDPQANNMVIILVTMVTFSVNFSAVGWLAWRGLHLARLYLLAWTPLIILTFVIWAGIYHWAVPGVMLNNIFKGAFAVLVLTMAFVLGWRINELTEERKVLKRKASAAETEAKAQSQFLANMSHEIRTPLNAIMGYAGLMQKDPVLTPPLKKQLSIISQSGEHLLALINDILQMSKIDSGAINRQQAHFDVHRLFHDIDLMFRLRCDERQLQLQMDYRDLPVYLYADVGKLRQILINLIGNAVKFTESGRVSVRASAQPLAGSENHVDSVNHWRMLVEVEDTGPGIEQENLQRIFQYFGQSESGLRKGEGTGLGLSISREYARCLGGDIQCESEVGKGSRFRLQLLCELGAVSEVDNTSLKPVIVALKSEMSPRILVADDAEANRELLQQILLPLGFDVQVVENGLQVVELAYSWRPHLILMDDRMPFLSGAEALRRIRANDHTSNIAIITMSASAFVEDRRDSRAAGADDFMTKPFDPQQLLEKIAQLLQLEYVYQNLPDVGQELSQSSYDEEQLAQGVERQSDSWREWLLAALQRGDYFAIKSAVDGLGAEERALAQGLMVILNRFDYELMIRLCRH